MDKPIVGKHVRHDLIAYKKLEKECIILILDNIRSAINVGSIFRTSDAFKIEKIYLCGITATPPNKEVLKSALGATESVDWEYKNDSIELVKELRSQTDILIYSVEQTQKSIFLNYFIPETSKKTVLIFGNEVDGVDQKIIDISDACIEIPQFGTKHSLNVAVTAGIVLWDLHCKLYPQNAK
jgi:23S rRNA (guanosine2251-2'-O)-methyltransferase